MTIPAFKSFVSSVSPFETTQPQGGALRMLVDPRTGAPTGIQSQNANGPDGIWTPLDVTAAQIASPTPAMLADLNAVYRLNEAPYTRYYSDGSGLVSLIVNSDSIAAALGADAATSVADLAALKALTKRPEVVTVETGQAKGVWQWEAGSSTTADDVLVVQCTSGTAGRYKRIYDGALYFEWFGDTGTTDDSAVVQACINAASTLTGRINAEAKTYTVENIVIKSNVFIVGEGKQVTRFKLKASSTGDVFKTQDVDTLWGTSSLSGATYRWGLRNLTIDGNASNVSSATKNRGIFSWSTGIDIQDVHILNCRGIGWQQGAPISWTNASVEYAGECRVTNLNIQRCNQRKDADVAGSVGGGGLYYNGPTDARFTELFLGWNEGGYSLKVGPNGASRYIGGEFWGGGYGDTVAVTSITRSGGTATATTTTAHGLATGEITQISGCTQTEYNKFATITVTGATTFTYSVSGSPASPATGSPLVTKVYFPQWAVISEALNGFTSVGTNLSGGYSGQALIRANGFRHWMAHNYLVAGDGSTAAFVQKGYQIGDSGNGYTNVAGVYIDVTHEDILGYSVDYNSSGGYNVIKVRGYANYSGYTVDKNGTLNAEDELDLKIWGSSTARTQQQPHAQTMNSTLTVSSTVTVTAPNSTADTLSLRGRASDSIGAIRLRSNDGATTYWSLYNSPTALQLERQGVQHSLWDTNIYYPNADATVFLGDGSHHWAGVYAANVFHKSYTVATMPAAAAGATGYASDGRKNGEGAGAGTGVLAFKDGSAWRACDTGATLAA